MAETRPDWDALFGAAAKKPASDVTWSNLYRALWPHLLDWVISRYGLSSQEAEDVLQDALLQYRTKLAAKAFTEPSLSHALAFVRYSALGYLRKHSRLVALDEIDPTLISPAAAAQDPERDLLQKLIVDEALERLDQRCAFALRAKYFHGQTSAEIGRVLGLESGAVDTLMHRCRAAARGLIDSFSKQLDAPR